MRRAAELRAAVAAFRLAGAPDLQQELALLRELEDLVVLVAVARDPDVAFRVDHDAVLALRPFVAGARAAPAAQVLAARVELGHRRQRLAAAVRHRLARLVDLVGEQRRGAVHHPDVAVPLVDPGAPDLAHDELQAGLLRQRLRPGTRGPRFRRTT